MTEYRLYAEDWMTAIMSAGQLLSTGFDYAPNSLSDGDFDEFDDGYPISLTRVTANGERVLISIYKK